VLINTELSFDPPDVISETYPQNLPNLYKGQQLIVSERYSHASTVTVLLKGTASGKDMEYTYAMNLTDSTIEKNRFLTKIWAKQKIEHLLVEYYSLEDSDPMRAAIKEDIVAVSLNYGVLSPFTSLSGDDPTAINEEVVNEKEENTPRQFELLGNYPNPFNPNTTIRFQIDITLHKIIYVKIYNSLGKLVRIISLRVDGSGVYEIVWNGLSTNGVSLSSGNYIYVVDFGNAVLAGKITLLK